MKTARVAWGGAVHHAVPHEAGLQLANGHVLPETEVVWLPPFEVGTIIALGLNYADHVKELSKELTLSAQDEPLVFLKTAGSVVGHRGFTPRPRSAAFMHYECELAVVIGREARRDHLENWYRPNLRVKNRDGGTVLGPWLVSADEVPEPQSLALRTLVNGAVKQSGSTSNMVNDLAALIEYLSSFMTLLPGDVILTGTPEGVSNVLPGDEVVCEIDGIGRLVSTLVDEEPSS
jgi:5-oxopent-3-ene-1,2,5-tricarboxylate decarboxylase/2-hydroxyhepta-2,4-diene-1,7-dioate isomerase